MTIAKIAYTAKEAVQIAIMADLEKAKFAGLDLAWTQEMLALYSLTEIIREHKRWKKECVSMREDYQAQIRMKADTVINACKQIKYLSKIIEAEAKEALNGNIESNLYIVSEAKYPKNQDINFSMTTFSSKSLYGWLLEKGYEVKEWETHEAIGVPVSGKSKEPAELSNTKEAGLLITIGYLIEELSETKSNFRSEKGPRVSSIASHFEDKYGVSYESYRKRFSAGLKAKNDRS